MLGPPSLTQTHGNRAWLCHPWLEREDLLPWTCLSCSCGHAHRWGTPVVANWLKDTHAWLASARGSDGWVIVAISLNLPGTNE